MGTVTRRQNHTIARLLLAALLIVLYVCASTQSGYLHELFHPDEIAAQHAPAQEADPCHRSIYHGMGTGCNHASHLVKIDSCGLTHALVCNDHLMIVANVGVAVTAASCFDPQWGDRYLPEQHAVSFSRGPPSNPFCKSFVTKA